MSTLQENRLVRAVLALPFLALSWYCRKWLNFDHAMALLRDRFDQNKFGPEGAHMPVIWKHFGVHSIDYNLRGIAAFFVPSLLGTDAISWWQMIFFLTDLAPIYVIWLLESCRRGNAWTPAYMATLWGYASQLLGIGFLAPIYCFLYFVFSPTASQLASNSQARSLKKEYIPFYLPLLLVLHNGLVFLMYFAPDPMARYRYNFTWQPMIFVIGFLNVVLSLTLLRVPGFSSLKTSPLFSAKALSIAVSILSFSVWAYVWLCSPFPGRGIFIPIRVDEAPMELGLHARRTLQFDLLSSFGGSLAWMAGLFLDMYAGGVIQGQELLTALLTLPAVTAIGGPGVAVLNGWWWRERKLTSRRLGAKRCIIL
ncbi:hypothetical protein QBC35DRAFT_521931 [Podospora australis]|uniref:Uncharacterized protein n=1 Tax=Podospora australis TaxID=1536484 RepID=A0AAN6WX62_9PEZI|nr:hypothetical protein QBC35DRAFT_521931 [Podospora australis]